MFRLGRIYWYATQQTLWELQNHQLGSHSITVGFLPSTGHREQKERGGECQELWRKQMRQDSIPCRKNISAPQLMIANYHQHSYRPSPFRLVEEMCIRGMDFFFFFLGTHFQTSISSYFRGSGWKYVKHFVFHSTFVVISCSCLVDPLCLLSSTTEPLWWRGEWWVHEARDRSGVYPLHDLKMYLLTFAFICP